MNDKIRKLEEQIRAEENKMRYCKHEYGKPFSNPEIKKEPYGSVMEVHGSDIWSRPAGYRDVSYPRWTRVCSICGKEDHTSSTKPIVSGHEPDFGKN